MVLGVELSCNIFVWYGMCMEYYIEKKQYDVIKNIIPVGFNFYYVYHKIMFSEYYSLCRVTGGIVIVELYHCTVYE